MVILYIIRIFSFHLWVLCAPLFREFLFTSGRPQMHTHTYTCALTLVDVIECYFCFVLLRSFIVCGILGAAVADASKAELISHFARIKSHKTWLLCNCCRCRCCCGYKHIGAAICNFKYDESIQAVVSVWVCAACVLRKTRKSNPIHFALA